MSGTTPRHGLIYPTSGDPVGALVTQLQTSLALIDALPRMEGGGGTVTLNGSGDYTLSHSLGTGSLRAMAAVQGTTTQYFANVRNITSTQATIRVRTSSDSNPGAISVNLSWILYS